MKTLIRITLFAGAGILALVGFAGEKSATPPKEYFVFFGTYTNAKTKSKGIYRAKLDVATGKLSSPEVATEASDPAFLAVHPTKNLLYAIDEGTSPEKTPTRG